MGWLWPQITDEEDAVHVARSQGTGVSIFCAVVTGIIVLLAVNGIEVLPGIGISAIADVVVLLIIAAGIHRMSRIAAVIGLIYYVVNRFYMIALSPGTSKVPFVVLLLVLAYINTVRATFLYHHFVKKNREPLGPVVTTQYSTLTGLPIGETPNAAGAAAFKASGKTIPFRKIFIITGVILLAGAAGGGAYMVFTKQLPQTGFELPAAVSGRPYVVLQFSGGQELEGYLLNEDAHSILIQIDGGEVIFGKNEIVAMKRKNAPLIKASSSSSTGTNRNFFENIFKPKKAQKKIPAQPVAAPAAPKMAVSEYNAAIQQAMAMKAQADQKNEETMRKIREYEEGY